MDVSWSDGDDSEDEVKTESVKHVTAMTGRIMSDTKSYDEELSYEELVVSYNELIAKIFDMSQMLEKQEEIINKLQDERSENLANISELNDEVTQMNSQLEHVKKHVRMMTTGTNVLEEMLEFEHIKKSESAGFNYKSRNKKQRNRNSAYALEDCGMVTKQQYDQKFVGVTGIDDSTRSKPMLENSKEHLHSRIKKKPNFWVCHHCKGKVILVLIVSSCMGNLSNLSRNHPRKGGSPKMSIMG